MKQQEMLKMLSCSLNVFVSPAGPRICCNLLLQLLLTNATARPWCWLFSSKSCPLGSPTSNSQLLLWLSHLPLFYLRKFLSLSVTLFLVVFILCSFFPFFYFFCAHLCSSSCLCRFSCLFAPSLRSPCP
jgi:hypothetical protein